MTTAPPPTPAVTEPSKISRWGLGPLPALGLVIASIVTVYVYWPLIPSGLVSDDWSILYRADARSLAEFWRLFEPTADWFYRPVQKLLFFISVRLTGFESTLLHLVFLLVHIANGWLMYQLAKRLGEAVAGAIGGGVFLLNPRLHEAVGWAAAGSEVLAGAFGLLSLVAFHRRLEGGSYWFALAGTGAFLLAALSKESAAALPLAVLAVIVVGRKRRDLLSRFADLVPLAIAAVLFIGLQFSTGVRDDEEVLARGGLAFGPQQQSVWIVTDLTTAALPPQLGARVALTPSVEPRREALILAVAALICAVAGSRLSLIAAIWTISATLVYVPFIEAIEDRYAYLPALGVCAVLGCLLDRVRMLIRQLGGSGPTSHAFAAGLVCLAACVIVGLGVPMLRERVDAWREAGERAAAALRAAPAQQPLPAAGSTLYFVGVPDTARGAFVFRNGLTEAVRLIYNDRTLRAVRLDGNPPAGAQAVIVSN